MRRKLKPAPDAETNALLVALLTEAKRRAVDRRDCRPATANRHMANLYIDVCTGFLSGASRYLPVEEYGAANVFLIGLLETGMRKQFNRHVGKCAAQLANHTSLYLPDFETLLEARFIVMMAQGLTKLDVRNNGLLRLSVAGLPYATDVVRRHLKDTGLNSTKLFSDNKKNIRRS